MIRRLAIIGVGLIGGSFALALRRAGAVGEVVGCGRGRANLQRACELGILDRFTQDPAAAVWGADLVLLAVPLGAMRENLAAIAPHLAPDAVVTDGGSVKGSVVADLLALFGAAPAWFVPGHPIAGTERSGADAALADLYDGRCVILTPLAETDAAALARVREAWSRCGAEVCEMSVAHHDEVLAATSHLPHLLAFGLVDSLARMQQEAEIFRYAAGGFRDFTRIASSNPTMWRDICIANRAALERVLDRFADELAELRDAVHRGDGERLLGIFSRAKDARDRYVEGRSS
jgi:prephenate dehydrogenase